MLVNLFLKNTYDGKVKPISTFYENANKKRT